MYHRRVGSTGYVPQEGLQGTWVPQGEDGLLGTDFQRGMGSTGGNP